MTWKWFHHHRCQSCGQFVNPGSPGVSSWQTWSYCMDGSPDLHDPVFQCSGCTDRLGYEFSNCHPPEAYQWRNPLPAQERDDGR